jgi:hypothetical protein
MALSKKTMDMIFESNLARHLDCFGVFDMTDPVCRNHCALCLKCIIEKNRKFQVDVMDDILTGETVFAGLN